MQDPAAMDDATMRDEMSMERQFGEVGASLDRRFDMVDERFDKIDDRFRKIDLRFDKVEHDIRLVAEGPAAFEEKMDRRFDAMEAKFDDTINWAKDTLQNHEWRLTTLEKPRRPRRRRH